MSKHLDAVLREAVDRGVLASAQAGFEHRNRPWAVVVLTFFSAWLAAIPLSVLVALIFLSSSNNPVVAFVLSTVTLVGTVNMLRLSGASLFVEQLSIPGLMMGIGFFLFGIGSLDIGLNKLNLALALTAPLPCGLAFLLPQPWLRVLLGATGASMLALSLSGIAGIGGDSYLAPSNAWQSLATLWLLGQVALSRMQHKPVHAHAAAVLETLLSGAGVATLAALTWYSGDTFLLSAGLPNGWTDSYDVAAPGHVHSMVSAIFALGAGLWMARHWPALRTAWFVSLTATALILCWFAVSMGVVLMMLAVSVTGGRRNLATLAGGAALWMTGALYYNLHWPLAYKSLLLFACGCAIGAIARFIPPTVLLAPEAEPQLQPRQLPAFEPRWKYRLIAGTGVLALIVVNAAIWEKEILIRTGRPVFVELAPVDPRSLMQGDYMALDYAFPPQLGTPDQGRAKLVAHRAPNGIVTLLALHQGQSLAQDEMLIEVIGKNGWPLIVTDAWYFKEGEADRWARARYGEFRVDASGKALLVGLRGPKLEQL